MLYGVYETGNGNWSQLDMTSELGASTTQAALALTAFWGMVTLGRVLFAAVQRRVPSRLTYHALPLLLAAAFVIAFLPEDEPAIGIVAFGLAGLGCSALLPLTISFGQEELTAYSAGVAGGMIAFYQLGYGIAAFGVGPLHDSGVGLPTIHAISAVVAAGLGACSFAVAPAAEPGLPPSAARTPRRAMTARIIPLGRCLPLLSVVSLVIPRAGKQGPRPRGSPKEGGAR